ncbi:MAG: hypothetical protein K6T66_13395 [Peptococcaceae bacterium]|nr:hypothetical protein [Peptococcaceae bacterium]
MGIGSRELVCRRHVIRFPVPDSRIYGVGLLKIEILTRSVEKKADIINCLRNLKGFEATAGKIKADGVEAELAPEYILLTTSVPWLADEIIRELFTVRPVPFAPSFYEIAGDPKVIVTCAARPVNQVIPALDVLEHLDLEAGELAGRFATRWSSRDVDVSADFEVFIQGGVAVSRVKFGTGFRESEHHCRDVLARVGLARGLSVFSAEDRDFIKPAEVSPVALTAAATVAEDALAAFLNRCPGKIRYLEEERAYRVELPGEGNRLTISEKNRKSAEVVVYLETPWRLDGGLAAAIGEMAGIERVEVARTITGIALNPDDLLGRLGFVKENEFLSFGARLEGLEARYDIGRRAMKIWAVIPWSGAAVSGETFDRIGEFTCRVMKFAV